MARSYSAFISYRHHPLDSAVAADIQRMVERFRIPSSLQKTKGVRKLKPVFRDKTELPITSDINDDILEALENADFLIVICTTHTAESVWVEREIDCFLQTHSQDRILTVLAEGEPGDVIPERLRWRNRQVVAPDGTQQTIREPLEPLSCDFRGYRDSLRARRMALHEEFPRLAAAILGCPYDALRQRQRQYQLRRLVAVLSATLVVSLGLIAYYIQTNNQIQASLEQALANQSQYLANESLEQSGSGDRLTALHLALAALPSETQERPMVYLAEYALSRAVMAYERPDVESASALCRFEQAARIADYFLCDDGSKLFVVDVHNSLTVWDVSTRTVLYSLPLGYILDEVCLAAEDSVLIWIEWTEENCVHAFDSTTGTPLRSWIWEGSQYDQSYFVMGDFLYLQAPSDEAQLCYQKINARTGETAGTLTFDAPEGSFHKDTCVPYRFWISPDQRYIAFTYGVKDKLEDNAYASTRIGLLDLVENRTLTIPGQYDSVKDVLFLDKVVFTHQITMGETAQVYGYDPEQAAILWENTFSSPYLGLCKTLSIDYPTKDGSVSAVVCAAANGFQYYRVSDGQLLEQRDLEIYKLGTNTDGTAVAAQVTDGKLQLITESGELVFAVPGEYYTYTTCFSHNVFKADIVSSGPDCYQYLILPEEGYEIAQELFLYQNNKGDDSWQPLSQEQVQTLLPEEDAEDSYALRADTADNGWLTRAGEPLVPVTLDRIADATFSISPDEQWGVISHPVYGPRLLLNLQTGATTQLSTEGSDGDWENQSWSTDRDDVQWSCDSQYFAVNWSHRVCICQTKTGSVLRLPARTCAVISSYFAQDGSLLVAYTDNYLYRYSISDGTLLSRSQLANMMDSAYRAQWTETGDGYLVLCSEGTINILSMTDWSICAVASGCVAYLPQEDILVTGDAWSVPNGYFPRHSLQELTERAWELIGQRTLTEGQLQEYGLR